MLIHNILDDYIILLQFFFFLQFIIFIKIVLNYTFGSLAKNILYSPCAFLLQSPTRDTFILLLYNNLHARSYGVS